MENILDLLDSLEMTFETKHNLLVNRFFWLCIYCRQHEVFTSPFFPPDDKGYKIRR